VDAFDHRVGGKEGHARQGENGTVIAEAEENTGVSRHPGAQTAQERKLTEVVELHPLPCL